MKCKYSQHSVSFKLQWIYWNRNQKQKRNYNYVILLPQLSQVQNSKHHGLEHPDRSALFLFWLLLKSPAYFVEIFLSQNLHIFETRHTHTMPKCKEQRTFEISIFLRCRTYTMVKIKHHRYSFCMEELWLLETPTKIRSFRGRPLFHFEHEHDVHDCPSNDK